MFTDSPEQLSIGLLSSQELMDYLLYICDSCLSSNLLEGVFYSLWTLHLLIHLHLVELGPHLLNHEVFSQFNFILIFVLIGCCFSNLTLPSYTVHSFLEGFFFITDTCLQTKNSLLTLLLLMINILHQIIEPVLRLQLILLRLPLFIKFIRNNYPFGF